MNELISQVTLIPGVFRSLRLVVDALGRHGPHSLALYLDLDRRKKDQILENVPIKPSESRSIATAEAWLVKRKWKAWC